MSNEKNTLIKVSNLKQYFPIGKKQVGKPQAFVRANDGISLEIKEGETFGLVGESGCGKSTLGRTLLQLYHQTAGRTVYYGRTVEDFDLKYVEEIFKNLPAKKKEAEEKLAKVAKLQAECEAMEESMERKVKEQELAELSSDANNTLLDITALIGGIYTLDGEKLAEVGKHFSAEYAAMKEIRGINAKVADMDVQGKSEVKIKALQDKIPAFEA